MRILVLNKYCPKHPLSGGAERRLAEVMKRIAGLGYEIHLVSARYPGCSDEEFFSGMHIHRIGLKNSNNTVLVHILGVLSMRAFIRKLKPDLIFEDISPLPWFSPVLARRMPRVVIFHHLNGRSFFQTQSFVKAWVGFLLEGSVFLLYKKENMIVINDYLAEILRSRGFRKVFKIVDGVDVKKYRPNPKIRSKYPVVLFLGRLERRKGADLLIKTYPIVKKSVPNVEYWIVGDGAERRKLESMAERIGEHGSGIRFFGFKDGIEKIRLIQKSWIVTVPSRAEGYGLSVLEANACGVPALANNVPGLSESVINGRTGVLTDCLNAEKFADALIIVLKDKKRLADMGRRARRFADKHLWESCARGTLLVLKKALEGKR